MLHPQILIHEMSFNLPNGKHIFSKPNLAFARQKVGLVGNNGVGKSTLIKLMTGELHPYSGSIQIDGTVAFVKQNPLFEPELTVAKILGFEEKLNALQRIEQGSTDPNDFVTVNDDWLIKEKSALKNYQGAMIVISHDQAFLESIAIERIIYAPFISTH